MASLSAAAIWDWRQRVVRGIKPYAAMTSEQLLQAMLIAMLSNRHRIAYDVIASRDGGMTSRQLADKMHLSINGASNLCRHLFELDLVSREECTDETGLYFKWKAI